MYKLIIALISTLLLANNVLAGEIEDEIGLEFSESECLEGSFHNDYTVNTRIVGERIEVRVRTGTSVTAKVREPKVRFHGKSLNVSVETYFPEQLFGLCTCGKELVFKFNVPNRKFEHVYFIQDDAVYAENRF